MYVYKIVNNINWKLYIWITKDIKARFKYHKTRYNNPKEYNKPLYNAFRKYWIENFSFIVLFEWLNKEETQEKEKELIKKLNTIKEWYNITRWWELDCAFWENVNTSILKEKEVIYILSLRNEWKKSKEVFNEFKDKISWSWFQSVRSWKNWAHLNIKLENTVKWNSKLSTKEVKEIKLLLKDNKSKKYIQQKYNLTYRDVWRIIKWHTYKNITI